MSDLAVTDDPGRSRYELRRDDTVLGAAVYLRHDHVIDVLHTEIEPDHEGEGLGSALARGLLEDARRRGLRVRPSCPFIAGWIEKHPDYQDLVA